MTTDTSTGLAAAPSQPSTGELALSVAQAATRLGVSHWLIYRLIREGRLRTIQIGTRRLVPISALRAFLDDGQDVPS